MITPWHGAMTYAETVPSWFLLNLKVVQVTSNIPQLKFGIKRYFGVPISDIKSDFTLENFQISL